MSATTRAFQITVVPARREASAGAISRLIGQVAVGMVIGALFIASVMGAATAARTVLAPTLENGLIHLVQPDISGLIR